jgi:hypothetical protein
MNKTIFAFLAAHLLILSLGAAEFVGQGSAAFRKKSEVLAARDAALQNARKEVLLKSVKNDLTTGDLARVEAGLTDASFLNLAQGFIRSETLVNETVLNGIYQVTIRGEVDLALLRDEISVRFGISADSRTRQSVMLLVEEFFSADFTPQASRVSREETVYEKKDILEDDQDIRRSDSRAAFVNTRQSESLAAKETHDDQATARSKARIDAKGSERLKASGRERVDGINSRGSLDTSVSGSLNASGETSASQSAKGSSSVKVASNSELTRSQATSSSAKNQTHFFQDQSLYEKKVVEFFPPESLKIRNPVPFVSAQMEAALLKRDIRLLDQATTGRLRDDLFGEKGLAGHFLQGDTTLLSAAATRAGREYGADMLVVGVNSIVDAGTSGEMFVAKSSMALKVIDASTGEIVAAFAYTQGGESVATQTAAKVSAQRLGTVVGPEIAEQIVAYAKKRADKGSEFQITLMGLSTTRAKFDFKNMFKKLKETGKIEDFSERRYDKDLGLLEMMVTSRLSVTDFKDAFLEAAYEYPQYENIEEEQSRGQTILYRLGTSQR